MNKNQDHKIFSVGREAQYLAVFNNKAEEQGRSRNLTRATTLEGYKKVLGAKNPYILTSVSNLVLVLQYQEKYKV